jgi:hypothetical protein
MVKMPLCAAVVLVLAAASLTASDPPPNLARLVAARETATAGERAHYFYTQSVRLRELDTRGAQTGEYRETRDVIFSPEGERSERFTAEPVNSLHSLVMTPEDFADIRNIQPFVLTTDQLWNYDAEYKGTEPIELEKGSSIDCYVLRLRPKHILSGQRLFDGMIWVRQDDYSVVRSEGTAVPQIITAKQENLFPRFVTTRRPVNGFWFPTLTEADDVLHFRIGAVREQLTIRYSGYKRFSSDSSVKFDQ